MSIERHASKIYTRAMFEQFGDLIYLGNAYRVEEIQKNKVYKETHTQVERREKWSRVVYEVKMVNNGPDV